MSATLSPAARKALTACIAKAGPNKGGLLSRAPSVIEKPLANAAWQAAMMHCNPYKVSIGAMILASTEQRAIFDEVIAFFDAHPQLAGLDRDRHVLSSLGVW